MAGYGSYQGLDGYESAYTNVRGGATQRQRQSAYNPTGGYGSYVDGSMSAFASNERAARDVGGSRVADTYDDPLATLKTVADIQSRLSSERRAESESAKRTELLAKQIEAAKLELDQATKAKEFQDEQTDAILGSGTANLLMAWDDSEGGAVPSKRLDEAKTVWLQQRGIDADPKTVRVSRKNGDKNTDFADIYSVSFTGKDGKEQTLQIDNPDMFNLLATRYGRQKFGRAVPHRYTAEQRVKEESERRQEANSRLTHINKLLQVYEEKRKDLKGRLNDISTDDKQRGEIREELSAADEAYEKILDEYKKAIGISSSSNPDPGTPTPGVNTPRLR